MNKPVVVIPTYNEIENIEALIDSIKKTIECRFIIIDDNSPDGTGQLLRSLCVKDSSIYVIHRTQKLGLASAYQEGFRFALQNEFDPIIQMDCDFSHDPKYLKVLVESIGQHDLVIGSKYVKNGQVIGLDWWRGALSRYGNLYLSWGLRTSNHKVIKDFTSGYMCWRRSLLSNIDLSKMGSRGYAFLIELKWHALELSADIEEIPIIFKDRVNGRSKMSPHIIQEALTLPFRIRTMQTRKNA